MKHHGIAVLGAGTMGHGIAYAAAAGGFETCLYDLSSDALEHARSRMTEIAHGAVQRGKATAADTEAAIGRLRTSTDLGDAVREVEFVIEAIPEKIELKLSLLGELEMFTAPTAIIASNTSALSITEMSAALTNPGRMAGMHFFNPVHKMKLVEIVTGLETSPETVQKIKGVAERMGKETVTVRESPGFITSRVNAMIGNEAFYMLQEGVASAQDIDKALKLGLNHPMGPFELVDLVGLDTRLAVLEFMHRTMGEKYRPCPLLVQYVKAGRLGKKVGRGVYEYPT